MTRMKFRQLIDMAIGSPDLGHVDFQALHFLLITFAERLEIVEDQIEYDKSGCSTVDKPKDRAPKNLSDYYTTSTEMTSPFDFPQQRISPAITKRRDYRAASEKVNLPHKPYLFKKPIRSACQAISCCTVIEPYRSPRLKAGGDEEPEAPPAEGGEPKEQEPEAPPEPEPLADPIPDEPQLDAGSVGGGSVSHASVTTHPTDMMESREHSAPRGEGNETITPENMKLGICMMKDQLELAMEQLTLLTEYMLEQKRDDKKVSILGRTLRKLRNIMQQNIYFESCFNRDESISWRSTEQCEEECLEEDYIFKRKALPPPPPVEVEPPPIPDICKEDLGLEPCLVYTADQLLDMFLEMRSEFCQLLNKVNTIAATILEQDYHGLMSMAGNLQKEQQQLTMEIRNIQYKVGKLELRLFSTLRNIENMIKDVEQLKEKKADKDQVLCWLSLKVNYEDLEKKLDKTELVAFQDEIGKELCTYRDMINTNERNIMCIIDNLRETLGVNFLEQLLYTMRDKFQNEIDMLNQKLDHYIAMTDDECAAATARVKVLKDMKCLSCDTSCVMHKLERGKVAKMGTSREANMLGPIITYELSRIRKSGIMGFYRKEDVPNTPNDFLKENEDLVNLEKCKPRHVGGAHTATTRKDFADKVMQKTDKKKENCYQEDADWYSKRP